MAFLGQEEQLREFQERFRFLYVTVGIAVVVLISRLVYLQIFSGAEMRQISEENRIKRVTIQAPRGMIYDRNRTLLVDNRPSFNLEVIPQYINESKRADEVLARLSKIIDMPVEAIQKRIKTIGGKQATFLPIPIKEGLTRDEVAKVESWKTEMPGVYVQMEIQRTSLYGDVAAHLLGYIGQVSEEELPKVRKQEPDRYQLGDFIGKAGIERVFEKDLRGDNGQELVEVDALGRRVRSARGREILGKGFEEEAVPGNNLVLTIDQDLQVAAAKAFGDKAGGLVAIDPWSGEILSMISRPGYDPTLFSPRIPDNLWNQLRNDINLPLRDKTNQDWYPPGSVFKVVTAFAAFEEGLLKPGMTFSCSGKIHVGNRDFHCHKRGGHGEVDVIKALEQSCDIFFYKLAQRFQSVDQIAKWAYRLGLGQKTGVNLPHEVPGLIATEEWKRKRFNEAWNPGETLSVAIGQGATNATVIQMANLMATIANGGTVYKPHFLKTVETSEGAKIREFGAEVVSKIDIDPKFMKVLQEGLFRVVNGSHGTAASQKVLGLPFSGKTGTSQVVRLSADKVYQKCENMKYQYRHHGWFAGYAPSDNPVIAVAALVEHGCHGSTAATPVVREVMMAYLKKYYPQIYEKAGKNISVVPMGAPAGED